MMTRRALFGKNILELFCNCLVCHDVDESTLTSGPNTNSASSGTRASEGRPTQSPTLPHPDDQKNSILSVKDSTFCDLELCHGHGNCVTAGKATRCQCSAGYKGEFCEEAETGRSHVSTVLGVLGLVALLMAAALVFVKR